MMQSLIPKQIEIPSFSSFATLLNVCCNTLGICHQLSNGFELKHGMLSDDENVKVKPMEMSPNLNLYIAPLLYI